MRDSFLSTPTSDKGADALQLASLGYPQELKRRMGGFSNFAISFSIICILAGGITSLQLGVSLVGGAAAGVVWPLGVCFSLLVALGMAQVASAFPTAGGLYHWSSILGGKGWGWATAWFNLLGLIFVTAAVNVGAYTLFASVLLPLTGVDPAKLNLWHQFLGVSIITLSQAFLNHRGIRVTTLLTDFSGYLILVVSAVLTLAMLGYAPGRDFSRLFQFSNFSGDAGGGVWPRTTSGPCSLLLALLWPVYTVTGYDGSAHTSEETVRAAENVPKGILRSVLVSGIFGWVMVSAIVLALPSVAGGAKQGANIFFWLMDQITPGWLKLPLEMGIVVSNYLCGLACVTSTSRMIYAFTLDGGLPACFRRVSPAHQVPAGAVWLTAALTVASTIYAPAYTTLTAACVIFLYLSYVMPTLVGVFAYGKRWKKMGPFDLGGPLYKLTGGISILGVAALVWAGVQPPNGAALPVTAGLAVVLILAWHLGVKKTFRGPPVLLAQTTKPVLATADVPEPDPA
jgi:hypothetical protein